MNICMLLEGRDFPPDIRVEKEARSLSNSGYKITIICDLINKNVVKDVWENCTIIRIPRINTLFLRKINKLIRRVCFIDIYWCYLINRTLIKEKIDIIHVHDLPMAGTAILLGKRHNIPVVLDFHENFPAAMKYYECGNNYTWFQHMFKFLEGEKRWKSYEYSCAKKSSRILVVVDEAKERLIRTGIPRNKITIIENTEDIDNFLNCPMYTEIIDKFKGEFVMLYIGGFGGKHRGLDTVIEAMPKILSKIPNARLLLVGDGPIKPFLLEMINERSINNNVTIIDWQPFNKVPSYIAASSICLVPHNSNPHTEATCPHKLFQYMLMGKPVVVSTCKPLQRVVEETGSGLVFEAGNSESLAEAVIRLKDEKLRRRLGEAGRQAVLQKYNWKCTSDELLRVYEELDRS